MTLSDLISISMTLGTGIIIFANIILINVIAYYRDEKDSLRLYGISFLIFGAAWILYIGRVFGFINAPIAFAALLFYLGMLSYYVASCQFLKKRPNIYFLSAFVISYLIIYWSPGASDSMSLRSYAQTLMTSVVYGYFAFIFYKAFRSSNNFGHIICVVAHTIILISEAFRLYLLIDKIEPILALGFLVVAHTIAIILNSVGIMTAFSFAHYKAIRNLSKQDSLTGLLNRRGFFSLYQNKSTRYKEVAVISCDIDYFKTINDNHGHIYGDQVLEKIALQLKQHTKAHFSKESLVARWGGEEFVIALFDCSINQANLIANALRESIYHNQYQINGQNFNLSLSFGVAHQAIEDVEIEDIINQSDQALYHAKSNGRNQVSCHSELSLSS